MDKLSESIALRSAAAPATSGTTDVNGSVFDLAGWSGVLIFVVAGTANAGNFLKAQQGEASNLSDAADIAGSKRIFPGDGKVAVLELVNVGERYGRGVVVRGAATTTERMWYIFYGANQRAAAFELANEVALTSLVGAPEGTA